jgi:hypothetical protein
VAQYGISKIRDRQILIAASEYGWIHERRSKDDLWAEIEPSEERTQQLVYGGFLLNPSQVTESLDPKSLSVMQGMEMAYVHFEPQPNGFFYSWRSLRIIDLEILDDQPKSDRFALAAIVDLPDEVPKTNTFSLSAFPFNSGLTVQQNIKTRLGILAINDVDRRNQRKLKDSNWRLLVDRPRARRAAARAYGPRS